LSGRRGGTAFLADPPDDLRGFPSYLLQPTASIHRIHRRDLSPWWFASDGRGRFDLVLRPGYGTCYLARTPVAGLLEVFKGIPLVPESEIDARRSFEAHFDTPLRLANACAPGAAQFGVNSELSSGSDYQGPQRWAAAWLDAGYAGIRYFVRSDPSRSLIGYALFGPAGRGGDAVPGGSSGPIAPETLAQAERWGLRVAPVPA